MKAEGEVLACSAGEDWQSLARLGCRVHCEEGGLKQRFYILFYKCVIQSDFIKTTYFIHRRDLMFSYERLSIFLSELNSASAYISNIVDRS